MSTLTRWCLNHRLIVVLLWVAAVIGLGVTTGAAGTAYDDDLSLPGTDSAKALELLQENLPDQSGDSGTIVWQTTSGSVRDAAVKQRMTAALDQVAKLPHVASVTGPYVLEGAGQISKDGRTAYAQLAFDGQAQDVPVGDVKQVIDTAQLARTDGLRVELGGNAIAQAGQPPPNTAEFIGIAAAAVVLFIAFGSLFAMLMPILTAVIALAAGLMSIGLLSNAFTIGHFGPVLGALMGLGVGIDYALFIVSTVSVRLPLRVFPPPRPAGSCLS
ncbi:MMPL family transporter [Micromonospora sp. NBC_01638]|uniref:MMPL family transporter n=1 Tax=Micromonospora sp. NBC_01638 TaxID=2975982 RepID=UPI0038665E35